MLDQPSDDRQRRRHENGRVDIKRGRQLRETLSHRMAAIELNQCGCALCIERSGIFKSTNAIKAARCLAPRPSRQCAGLFQSNSGRDFKKLVQQIAFMRKRVEECSRLY